MRYISTRGGAPAAGFLDAVLEGLAPDGGLYVPETWPAFSPAELKALATMDYPTLAAEILARFAGEEIDRPTLQRMCEDAYSTFSHAAVTPLKQLERGLWLLELFHGPTLAFKDVAMQLLARLYDHALGLRGRTATIVVATSGDTGGAAVEAFRGRKNVQLIVLYPHGRISEVQRRFITTAADDNVRVLALDGVFDDCQAIVKTIFQDQALHNAGLSGVNSINWSRIAAQTVYYFASALALGAPARPVSYAVPTGNFGDAFAGYVASRMGLPIERMIVATNGNDIMSRAVETGRYARGEVLATQSPAMDIQAASNFERLYYEGVGRDAADTARAMQGFSESGSIGIPAQALSMIRGMFRGAAVDEAETSRTILETLKRTGELIDPHTAVGVAAARRIGPKDPATPLVVLSTAHPAKFPETVLQACGVAPALTPQVRALEGKPERILRLPADTEAVKAVVREAMGA
jgi:threonine synthase